MDNAASWRVGACMGLIMLIAVLAAVAVARPTVGFDDWPRATASPAPEQVVAAGPPDPPRVPAPASEPATGRVAAADTRSVVADGPASAPRREGPASPVVQAGTRLERDSAPQGARDGRRTPPAPEPQQPPAVPVEQDAPPAASAQTGRAAAGGKLARGGERTGGGEAGDERRERPGHAAAGKRAAVPGETRGTDERAAVAGEAGVAAGKPTPGAGTRAGRENAPECAPRG